MILLKKQKKEGFHQLALPDNQTTELWKADNQTTNVA